MAMKLADAKKLIDEMREATVKVLQGVRDEEFGCVSCGVPNGKQHLKRCVVWPLIECRRKYWAAEEGDSLEVGVE